MLSLEAEGLYIRIASFRWDAGVRVHPIGPLFHPDAPRLAAQHAGLVMGYASLSLGEIEEGVRRLTAALDRLEAARGTPSTRGAIASKRRAVRA